MSQAPTPRRASLWLLASLMVNMLLIGLFAGHLLGGKGGRQDARSGPPPPGEAQIARSLVMTLDEDDRPAMRAALRSAMGGNRGSIRQMREARSKLASALRAEPYDAGAVASAFERMRSEELRFKTAFQEALAAQLETLTPQQRQALAERLEMRRAHQRRGRRGHR